MMYNASDNAFIIIEIVAPLLSILGNCVALDGVVSGDISMAGYRRFLISLLASDLFIGAVKLLIIFMEFISYRVDFNMQLHKCFGEMGRSLEITGFIAYLLNLCGMFVDHYIALRYPHRYKSLMDKWFAKVAVFLIWPSAFIIGFITHPTRAVINFFKGNSEINISAMMMSEANCSSPAASAVYADQAASSFGAYAGSVVYTENYDSEVFGPDSLEDIPDNLPLCKPENNVNATMAVLDAVRRGLDFEAGPYRRSWCASFDRTSKLWLDWIVVILALGAATFLGICYTVFRRAVGRAGRAKKKLQQLTITTFLLLGAFILCWMPYTSYELFMELIFQAHQGMLNASSSQTFFVVHNFLHLLFICSPLLVPIIYVARLKVVQRQIVKRYGAMIPTCLRRKLALRLFQQRNAGNNDSVAEITTTDPTRASNSRSGRSQNATTLINLEELDSIT